MRSSAAPYACTDTGLIDNLPAASGTATGKITPSVPSGQIRHSQRRTGSPQRDPQLYRQQHCHGPGSHHASNSRRLFPDPHGCQRCVGALSVCFPGWRYTDQSGNTLTAEAASGASWQELTFTASRETPQPDSASCFSGCFIWTKTIRHWRLRRAGPIYPRNRFGPISKSRRQNSLARRPIQKNRGQRKRGGLLL